MASKIKSSGDQGYLFPRAFFGRPPNPGPLVQAYDGLGTVQPIVFGYLAEASAGACDLIKSVADELAPRYADLYLLESVEAAVGIATDRLREEIGATVFKAQARVVLDRNEVPSQSRRTGDRSAVNVQFKR